MLLLSLVCGSEIDFNAPNNAAAYELFLLEINAGDIAAIEFLVVRG